MQIIFAYFSSLHTESLLYPQGIATLPTPLQEVSGGSTIDN